MKQPTTTMYDFILKRISLYLPCVFSNEFRSHFSLSSMPFCLPKRCVVQFCAYSLPFSSLGVEQPPVVFRSSSLPGIGRNSFQSAVFRGICIDPVPFFTNSLFKSPVEQLRLNSMYAYTRTPSRNYTGLKYTQFQSNCRRLLSLLSIINSTKF